MVFSCTQQQTLPEPLHAERPLMFSILQYLSELEREHEVARGLGPAGREREARARLQRADRRRDVVSG